MKAYNIALLFLFVFTSNFYAQKRTGTNIKPQIVDEVPAVRSCFTMQSDSLLRVKFNKINIESYEALMKKAVASYRKSSSSLRQEADTMIIPIIVHVVHNGDAYGAGPNITADQVYSQLDVLNEDYNKKLGTNGYNTNPVGTSMVIKFVPAAISINGANLDEPGIHRYNGGQNSWDYNDIENTLKPATIWDPEKYFNIWTAKFGGSLASTLGYTQFPSLSGLDGLDDDEGEASTDGVIIRYNVFGRVGNLKAPYNLGRTASHEIGHFFGLRHIWGDITGCKGTDYCDDTPKTTDAIYGCPSSAPSCTTGVQAMYQNYMDYTNDDCMNIFTNDQKSRLMAVLQVSPRRKGLLSSNVYIAISIPKARFDLSNTSICKNNSVTFTDVSTKQPTSWAWTIYNSKNVVVTTSGVNSFAFNFQNIGNYSVKLIVTNQFGSDTLLSNNCLQVISDNQTTMPYLESLEGTTVLGNWVYYNPEGDTTWKVNNQVSAYGIGSKSVFYNNYDSTYDKTGIENGIISPKFNLQTSLDAYLTFDVAYTQYKTSDGDLFSDSLAIYYTSDCGQNYDLLWQRGGSSLATAAAINGFFVPISSQWRNEKISLTPLNGKSDVNFIFMNKSGWGNALYLDNINILIPNRTAVPVSDFVVTPISVCGGGTISLSDRSSQYPTSWAWTITGASNHTATVTSTLQYPDITLDVAGAYNVKLEASNTLGTGTTNTKLSTVNAGTNPIVSLKASSTEVTCRQVVIFTAYGASKYIWYTDRSLDPITTLTSYSITDTLKYSSTYYVYGFDANNCVGSDQIDISVSGSCSVTGISEVSGALNPNDVKIYPNPAENTVYVDINYTENAKVLYFNLYSPQSDKVLQTTLQSGKNTVSLTGIIPGMYFYSIGNNKFGKLIIE